MMTEVERTREFMENLVYAEELILDSVQGLNRGCPVGDARKQIIGTEKNCKLIKLDSTFMSENPYIKNIQIGNWIVGNVCLTKTPIYESYKTYNYNARKRDPKTLTSLYELCYFSENMHIPTIGTVFPDMKWMGVEPCEMNTFSSFIEEASGKILLMGCGLGYVAYMLSLKEEVEEITIVELDSDVKKMFELYLKPQMNSKIHIVKGDAIEFLKRENLSMYQYCSVDIWHGAFEMFPIYLKCLLLEVHHPKTKFHYWLEEDLYIVLETFWIILLRKLVNSELTNKKAEIFTNILFDQNIETLEDIRKFILAPKRQFIKEWVLNHPKEAMNHKGFDKTLKL